MLTYIKFYCRLLLYHYILRIPWPSGVPWLLDEKDKRYEKPITKRRE